MNPESHCLIYPCSNGSVQTPVHLLQKIAAKISEVLKGLVKVHRELKFKVNRVLPCEAVKLFTSLNKKLGTLCVVAGIALELPSRLQDVGMLLYNTGY